MADVVVVVVVLREGSSSFVKADDATPTARLPLMLLLLLLLLLLRGAFEIAVFASEAVGVVGCSIMVVVVSLLVEESQAPKIREPFRLPIYGGAMQTNYFHKMPRE